jgi:hypothetical protein
MIDFWHIALSFKGPSAIVGGDRRIVIKLRDDFPTREHAIRHSAEAATRLIKQFNGPTCLPGGCIWRPKENA